MRDGALEWTFALQRDPQRRWVLALAGTVFGLALASAHWGGLFVGGALVGWAWPTLGRSVLAGIGFALVALVAFAVALAEAGSLGAALGTGQIALVTVASAIVLGGLGGLSRGLVPDAPQSSD
jgi:NO-binding membrane sensor protein with MHYT domain